MSGSALIYLATLSLSFHSIFPKISLKLAIMISNDSILGSNGLVFSA